LCSRFEISVSNLITISPPQIHIPPSRRLREINQTKPYPPHLGTFEFESDYHRHRWIRLFSSWDVPWCFFIQPLISSGGLQRQQSTNNGRRLLYKKSIPKILLRHFSCCSSRRIALMWWEQPAGFKGLWGRGSLAWLWLAIREKWTTEDNPAGSMTTELAAEPANS
jgi:hypothetical protein